MAAFEKMLARHLVQRAQNRGIHDATLAHGEKELHAGDSVAARRWLLHARPLHSSAKNGMLPLLNLEAARTKSHRRRLAGFVWPGAVAYG